MVERIENYFDRWERGEYSIDPRDLVPYVQPVGAIIRPSQAPERSVGERERIPAIESTRAERLVAEEHVLIAA